MRSGHATFHHKPARGQIVKQQDRGIECGAVCLAIAGAGRRVVTRFDLFEQILVVDQRPQGCHREMRFACARIARRKLPRIRTKLPAGNLKLSNAEY